MAEGLGTGLQNLVHRFKSGRHLPAPLAPTGGAGASPPASASDRTEPGEVRTGKLKVGGNAGPAARGAGGGQDVRESEDALARVFGIGSESPPPCGPQIRRPRRMHLRRAPLRAKNFGHRVGRQLANWPHVVPSAQRLGAFAPFHICPGASPHPMSTPDPTVRAAQQRLLDLGYDPGPIDGEYGPRTSAAVRSFQFAAGVTQPDGKPLKFPGSIGPSTLAALGIDGPRPPVKPPWMAEGERVLGLHEDIDTQDLSSWLKADGRTLGDPRKLPWCGDFVETCVRLALPTEPIPANPYGARNWLDFGRPCGPALGAVAVFWRVAKNGWQGHVGFLAGENPAVGKVYVLGGNQSDRVSVVALSKSRLLGYRWPAGYPLAAVLPAPETDVNAPLEEDLV